MYFRDPLQTLSVQLPTGWALDIASSSMTDLVFTNWATPDERNLFLRLRPSPTVRSVEEWVGVVSADLPAEVVAEQLVDELEVTLWVARPGREGRPDQRWAIRRGTRLDVVLEDVGVPLGGPLRTPVLEAAARSLDVPVNRDPPARPAGTWNGLMDRADALAGGREAAASLAALHEAHGWAMSAWLAALAEPNPDARLVVAAAHTLLRIAAAESDVAMLHDAMVLLLRSKADLDATDRPTSDGLLAKVYRLLGEATDGPAPANPLTAALACAEMAVRSAVRTTADAAPYLARLATEISAECFVLAARVQPAEVALAASTRALELMAAANAAGSAASAVAAADPQREVADEWLAAARELHRRRATPASAEGVALADLAAAAARQILGDRTGLETARELLADAETRLAEMSGQANQRGLQARVWLLLAWVEHGLGRHQEALDVATRIEPGTDVELARAKASVQSAAHLALGEPDEALRCARAAIGEDDPAESAHRLALALALNANEHWEEALDHARLGLVAALGDNPLANTTVRLLYLLGELLDAARSPLCLRTTMVAQDLLDLQARGIGSATDAASFDETEHHRAISAGLVLRLLRAGHVLAALAAADHARARTLDAAFWRTAPGDNLASAAVSLPRDLDLEAAVQVLAGIVAHATAQAGVAARRSGEDLVALVAQSGRRTLLVHPTPDGLVRFLVHPDGRIEPSVVAIDAAALSALTGRVRRQLAITVVSRSARGALPSIEDQQVLDELNAWASESAPDPDADEIALETDLRTLGGCLLDALALPDGDPLAVVPYRDLATVPLSALQLGDGRRLVSAAPISAMPSIASVLGAARPATRPAESRRAVVVGDPKLNAAEGLPPLQGARQEAATVVELLGRELCVVPLLGGDATESALREHAAGARLVHFACHAAVREPADQSRLYLAASAHDDGHLTVADAADLLLDEALVVLAACESGLGRVTPDGVHGLGQAFVRAGARSVLLSLWPVGDASTGFLMDRLYRVLLGVDCPRSDVATALAVAQREAMLTYPDLAQWAPWLLMGDGGWRLD